MKTKKILVFLIALFFVFIISNNVFAAIPDGMSEEFKQILNEEGKFVITDTSNNEYKNFILMSSVNKYATDAYDFQIYFIDAENTKCRIQRHEITPYNILESYDVEVIYEEKFSDEFKKITDDGNIVITSSSAQGREMLLFEYCNLNRSDNVSFSFTDLNEDKTIGTLQMFKKGSTKVAEQHLVNIKYEEKFSDEFKKIANDGKITIRASRDEGKNSLIQNYCWAFREEDRYFSVTDINEDGTLCTIQMNESVENKDWTVITEQHRVKIEYDKTVSQNFKKYLNKNGKFVIDSIKPKHKNEWLGMYEVLFYNKGIEADIEFLEEDFSSCEIIVKDNKGIPETHNVEFEYKYDEKVKEFVDTITKKIPQGETYLFKVKDMELVNYWLNSEEESDKQGIGNLDNYSGELKSFVDYKNLNLSIDHRLGADAEFFTLRGGIGLLQHKGTTYYINDLMGVIAHHILYVPDSTGSSKEELLNAVQKRVDEYAGKGKVKITVGEGSVLEYYGELDEENAFLEKAEGNYWFIATIDGIEHKFIVIKDSKSMINPKHKTKDFKTDIEISTDSNDIPLDTLIEANRLTEGKEYERIIKILGVEENITFDLNLFSKSLNEYIKKLENGTFEVKIPVSEKFQNKKLVIYYVDEEEKIEEYEVEVKNGYAIFRTNHFSTYTLAEEKVNNKEENKDNIYSDDKENINTEGTTSDNINQQNNSINPKTGDDIVFFVVMFMLSIIAIICICTIKYKK